MRLALTLFLVVLSSAAQTPKRNLVQLDVPDQIEAHAGKEVEVPVKFWVADGYHINSNKPTEEYMIPTKVDWQPSPLKHVGDVFPAADQRAFGFTKGKKLSVFEGTRTLKARFAIPASGASGTLTLEGTFRYQACDQAACYPPGKVAIKVAVKVLDR
jgi:hypothetical protein